MNELINTNIDRSELVNHFLESLKTNTKEAYRNDLEGFKTFLGYKDIKELVNFIVQSHPGKANLIVLKWRTLLTDEGLSPSSINRKLAAIRSLVSFARMLGIINWNLEVKNLKSKSYKNVRGPGESAYKMMMNLLAKQGIKQSKRDRAILVLLHDLALRRAEVCKLNIEDIVRGPVTVVAVSGKGRDEKELLTIPQNTLAIIDEWIEIRGNKPGPLFTSMDRAKKGSGRLTSGAIYERIRSIGKSIGIETHPHALRHLAITEACKLAQAHGIGLEEILNFSRHSNVNTLMIYRDKERDVQGKISDLLSKINK